MMRISAFGVTNFESKEVKKPFGFCVLRLK